MTDRSADDGDDLRALAEEIADRRRPSWQHPFHWWGPPWARPEPRTLAQLVDDRVIDAATAEMLLRDVAAGGSVLVAAGPSHVGKSTLAAALVDLLPPEVQRVYLRGSYETFDFLGTPSPGRRALLVNELSPHLPIYLWGDTARRALRLARDGDQLIGTIHASTPEELIYQLARSPIHAAPTEIAALRTAVFLGPAESYGSRWRVTRIVRLTPTSHGVRVEEVEAER